MIRVLGKHFTDYGKEVCGKEELVHENAGGTTGYITFHQIVRNHCEKESTLLNIPNFRDVKIFKKRCFRIIEKKFFRVQGLQ